MTENPTYYGKPVIKAPHWGWLIISYFFLGGISGASFTIGTLANMFSKDPAVERTARYLSLAALVPCPILLILDLGRPERFLNMLRVLKLRSPMSLGSWALSGLGLFATLAAALQFKADTSHGPWALGHGTSSRNSKLKTQNSTPQTDNRKPKTENLLTLLGLPFSIFLSGYTGVLLAATNIPIWWRASPLIAPTFVSSAYSTSLAAITFILGLGHGEREDTAKRLARAEAICLTAELGFMTAMLIRLGKIGQPLRSGRLGLIFWPVTYFGGIVAPLLLQLNGPVQGRAGSVSRRRLTALLALSGGFSFRALMIFAGRESARRPEDYFAVTRAKR